MDADVEELERWREVWRTGGISRTPERAAMHALTDRLREVIRSVVLLDVEAAGAEAIAALERDLDGFTERLRELPDITPGTPATTSPTYALLFERSPITGVSNPIAPPLRMRYARDVTVATVTYTEQHEGPPHGVHGGIVAAAFDELLGVAQMASGAAGFTARLEVTYRARTPLHREIRYEARVASRHERKVTVEAASYDGDTLLAEASGLFIAQGDLPVMPDMEVAG